MLKILCYNLSVGKISTFMPKDTYALIIAEIRNVVKQFGDLRRRTFDVRKRMGEEQDKVKIQKIKSKLGI